VHLEHHRRQAQIAVPTGSPCNSPTAYPSKSCRSMRSPKAAALAHACSIHNRCSQPRAVPQHCHVGRAGQSLFCAAHNISTLNSSFKVSCCVAQAVLRSTDQTLARAYCSVSRLKFFSACATCWTHGASLFAIRDSPALFSMHYMIYFTLLRLTMPKVISLMHAAAVAALICSCRILL
jgi:hypothetical protein